MAKYPILIAEYKGYRANKTADSNDPGNAPDIEYVVVDKKAIVWVSQDLYEALGTTAADLTPTTSSEVTTLNDIPLSSAKRGTFHGKTAYIETDQQTPVPENATYKKRYQLQMPNDCPVYFLKTFAEAIQADNDSPLKNHITKIYLRGGTRYPILQTGGNQNP